MSSTITYIKPKNRRALLFKIILAYAGILFLIVFRVVESMNLDERATVAQNISLNNEIRTRRDQAASTPANSSGKYISSKINIDEAVRYLNNRAGFFAVQIYSLSLNAQSATVREWGIVKINVAANGEYPKVKSLLQDMLDRYPSMAAHTISLRNAQTGVGRVDVQLELAIYCEE